MLSFPTTEGHGLRAYGCRYRLPPATSPEYVQALEWPWWLGCTGNIHQPQQEIRIEATCQPMRSSVPASWLAFQRGINAGRLVVLAQDEP